MAKDVSIVFKASDNLTQSIMSMRKSVDGLSRDVSEYRKIQSNAFDKKTQVKFDITKAKSELKELERAVKNNAEGSEKAFKEKQRALEDLQEEYRRLTKVAKEASKAEDRLQEDISKTRNKSESMMSGNTGVAQALAGAGLGKMAGDALGNGMDAMLTSAFGDTLGSAIGGTVGNIATGAAIGSIAGPVGTAVGAAVGGLTGAINGLAENQRKQDDFFKAEVQDIYNNVKQEQQQSMDNGISMAAKREKDMISFSTLLKGNENADKFLKDIQNFSARTPFEMNDLLGTSKSLLSYRYSQDDIIPMMTKIGDTGSALDISSDEQKLIAETLGKMKQSPNATREYIDILTSRAIPAIDYLAEAYKKTNGEIYTMISKGLIEGEKASKIIVDGMGKQFADSMKLQSATYDGLLSTLNDKKAQIDMSMGEGYTEERKKGMEKEIEQLNGVVGEKMKEANSLIGQYKADLENKYQQSIIDSMADVMNNKDNENYEAYQKAKAENNGAEMGRILAEARAKAETEYRNSDAMKLQLDADLALVEGIQKDVALNKEYNEYGKRMAEQFSKGWLATIQDTMEQTATLGGNNDNDGGIKYDETGRIIKEEPKSHATGLDRVPYDGYPALLHKGEEVLTRVEADKRDKQKGSVNINIASMIVREEADIDKIGRALASRIVKASEVYAGGV